MPRKPPAIEPPATPDEDTTPIEGSEPTASTEVPAPGASTSSATEDGSVPTEAPHSSTSSASEGNPPTAGGPATESGNRFFSWIRGIDIRREPGWIGGVCAGIAARLGIDPLIVRGIAVVIAVLGGPAILLYAVAWLLLPDANDKIHLEEVFRGRLESPIAAIGALIVLSLLPVTQGFWFAGAGFWGEPDWGGSIWRVLGTLGLLTLLVWFIVWLARRGPNPAPSPATRPRDASAFVAGATETTAPTTAYPANASEPEVAAWREQQAQVRAEQDAFRNQQASDRAAANRAAAEEAQRKRAAQRELDRAENLRTRSHPLFSLIVIGLSIVAGGLATVSVANGDITVTAAVIGLAVMLAVLAVGIIINGVRGKRSGGAAGLAAIVLPALLITAAVSTNEGTFVRWGPTTELSPAGSQSYTVGGGRVELDLTDVQVDAGDGLFGEDVSLRVGAGDITVIVPNDVYVQFSGTVGAGSIETGTNGPTTRIGPIQNASADYVPGGAASYPGPQISVSVQLGAGRITVIEEGDNR